MLRSGSVLLLLLARTPPVAAQEMPAIQAVRVNGALALDGRLDDPAWKGVSAFADFIQQVPVPGTPATERTEVQVVYDDEALYVGVRAFHSPGVPIVANELRRDAGRVHVRNDTFTVALDTFFDRRNGYLFIFTPLGAVADWAFWDEGRAFSQDWDAVWEVKTSVEEWGWSAEMRLPFRSLRFQKRGPQRWGIQFRRVVLAKNEWSYATVIPPEWTTLGIAKFSSEAELQGVVVGRRSLNLELNPYVLAGAVQDTCGVSGCQTDVKRDVGLDLKLSVTPNLTLDLTYNTDFSQVEADEQQINFTRFNLFFPEKRQFFLEGKGIFDFGITTGDYLLLPFFSRRIGLERDRAVPILGGARLTGKAGNYSVGALAIRTEEAAGVPDTNFSVVRVRRDVLRRSSIGFIATDRRGGSAQNEAFGADAHFAFSQNAKVESFVARAWSPGREADSWAGRLRAANEGDRFTAEVEYLRIGRNFNPQIGFVRRRDVDRWFTRVQASPRPRRGPVRKVFGGASFDYVRNGAGRLESRDAGTFFKLEFHSADLVEVTVTRRHDAPPTAFEIGGLSVAAGSYGFTEYAAIWDTSKSHQVGGRLELRGGRFYGGTRREVVTSAILKANRHFYADVNYQLTDLALATGSATAQLFGVRLNYSATTRVFQSALLQWNNSTHEFNANVRLNWIYRPGSNLYIVYSRTSGTLGAPVDVQNHSLVMKLTRLLQF